MRDLSRITAGLLQSVPQYFATIKQFVRLWRNEITRVIYDRLINDEVIIASLFYLLINSFIDFSVKGSYPRAGLFRITNKINLERTSRNN